MLNPANTGNFDGAWRAYANYRHQGDKVTNPYSTYVADYDMPIYYFNRIGSFGFMAMSDRTACNTLNTNSLQLSTAHFVRVAQKSYLHMGFGFTLVNKETSTGDLSFPNQFDNTSGQFNPLLPDNENFNKYSVWYLDLSWGFMWTRISDKLKTQLGVAMFHYNKPNLDFFGNNEKLDVRFQTHFYSQIALCENVYAKPKVIYTLQSKASELLIGTDIGLNVVSSDLKDIYAGVFSRAGFKRNSDAIIVNAGFNFSHLNINFSYDYSLIFNSTMYNNETTFEVSLIYILPHKAVTKHSIQCEIL